MRRYLAAFLGFVMVLSGCSSPVSDSTAAISEIATENEVLTEVIPEEKPMPSSVLQESEELVAFASLNDAELLDYVQENVYNNLVETLDSTNYFVETVSTSYISKEYLEEIEYNSRANVYFGYTLAELDEYFQASKYVFTLGDDGQTTVRSFEAYDDTYDRVFGNVAAGTGVILVCITVSVVAGSNLPAVSLIFAASAKNGATFALSSGVFSAVTSGVVRGIETGDMDEAIKSAALSGSEGFKWGAISGAFSGASVQAAALRGATLHGLTMNEAAQIQQESKLPLEFIKNFHSMDEYNVYRSADLQLEKVNGNWAYTQKIDWNFVGDEQGRTNAQRVMDNLAPLDATGKPYELHHVGQMDDSPLAILSSDQHHGNYRVLHSNTGSSPSNIVRDDFQQQKQAFWKAYQSMTYGDN